MEYAIIGETAMMYYNSRATTENSPFRSIELAVENPEEAATVLERGETRVSRLYDYDVRSFCYSGTDGYPRHSFLLYDQKVTFLPSDLYLKDLPFTFNEHQSKHSAWDSEHIKDWVWTWPGKQNEHVPYMPFLAHFFLSLTYRAADAHDTAVYESAKVLERGMNLSMIWLCRAIDSYEPYDCADVALYDMVVSTKEILEAQEANFQLRGRDGITSEDDA